MTVCILGINLFQAYWLFQTYQLTLEQFKRAVREALFESFQNNQLSAVEKLVKQRHNGQVTARVTYRDMSDKDPKGPKAFFYSEQHSEGLPPGLDSGNGSSVRRVIINLSGKSAKPSKNADTLARKLSDLFIYRWSGKDQFNLKQFTKQYETELANWGITDPEFVLDTLSRKSRFIQTTDQPAIERPGYRVQTPLVPINPVRGQFVQASFKTPTTYILRRMGWLLATSVVLLILTTGCFLFMLSTILRQKKLSDIKNDFINNMTHELKTPIATVSAAVEAMQHFGALNDPKKTQTYLTISQNELRRLSDLVEKVLNMAVEEQKEMVLQPDWIDPAGLVQELVQRHQLKAPKPVTFQVDIEPEMIKADPMHLANVINNLIDNAIKYSDDDVTIRISGVSTPDGWQLTVADNGPGIPKGYQEAIFDRFFRVPTGNLHPVKGFGLGLYYVRQVIERHGGTIRVQSETGASDRRGSEFFIWLPL